MSGLLRVLVGLAGRTRWVLAVLTRLTVRAGLTVLTRLNVLTRLTVLGGLAVLGGLRIRLSRRIELRLRLPVLRILGGGRVGGRLPGLLFPGWLLPRLPLLILALRLPGPLRSAHRVSGPLSTKSPPDHIAPVGSFGTAYRQCRDWPRLPALWRTCAAGFGRHG